MIVKGSLRYGPSGRKRKEFKPAKPKRTESSSLWIEQWLLLLSICSGKRIIEKYPSLGFKPGSLYVKRKPQENFREEVSKQYTVSIPYNKGAYQVIPEDEVKGIGK